MRLVMGVEYNGAAFGGWQRQDHAENTVQGAIERALSKVADQPVQVVCAGRTDRGVHALGQVIHFDTTAQREHHAWVLGGTANLPKDVSLLWAREAVDDFHARFSARRRHYRYVIFNRRVRPSFLHGRVAWEHQPLDAARMAQAAPLLLGEHDFSAFRARECQSKSAHRHLYRLDVRRLDDFVILDVEANAFLHHMVRNIAGVLLEIGSGKRPPQWAGEVLAGGDRSQAGITAPAEGLYFMRVYYPEHYQIPLTEDRHMVW